MTPEQMENGRIGVELMTAWCACDKSGDFFSGRLSLLVKENWDDGMEGRTGLLKASIGLADVAGLLLVRLAQRTGHTEEEVLQEVARHFQSQE
jgi:hypothetical protein